MVISMLKIRRPLGRLIFNMGIAIPGKTVFLIETAPRFAVEYILHQGWGLLSQFSPFRYSPYFPLLSKQTLAIECHVYIWQVLPQLSCGDTCQIWMWFRESNRYFCNIEYFAYGEISERSFSNPHPRTQFVKIQSSICHVIEIRSPGSN